MAILSQARIHTRFHRFTEICNNLFIMLKMVVLTFESVEEIHSNVIIQMRATQQYFYVVLFIALSEVLLTLKSVKATINSNTFPGADPHWFPPFYRNRSDFS